MTIRIVKVNGLRTPEQRASVCYVGRTWAGWPASRWMNPFRPVVRNYDLQHSRVAAIADCLSRFREYAAGCVKLPGDWLADLWEACEHGAKPLGCWCLNAELGDGQPEVCHAQVLAEMLSTRFGEANR